MVKNSRIMLKTSHEYRDKWALSRENLSSGGLQITKAQTSLRIRAVWSAPLLLAYYKVSYPDFRPKKFQVSS